MVNLDTDARTTAVARHFYKIMKRKGSVSPVDVSILLSDSHDAYDQETDYSEGSTDHILHLINEAPFPLENSGQLSFL